MARVDFALYYEQHMARLILHVMRQGASPHEAAEAVQAAFTEAFTKWESIDSPGGVAAQGRLPAVPAAAGPPQGTAH